MPSHKQIERYLVFGFGFLFVAFVLGIALVVKEPSNFQWFVFRVVLGLAAAGIAAFIPGLISVQLSTFVRAGGAIAVFVLIYSVEPASFLAEGPLLSVAEEKVLSRKQDVLILRGTWEGQTPYDKIKVSTEAPLLGQAILAISDKDLRLGYLITKYEYAAYSYVMACDSSTDRSRAEEYCKAAIEQGTKYLSTANQAQLSANQSSYNSVVAEWARNTRQLDRANYQLALAHTLLFQTTGEAKELELARQYYAALSPAHKQSHSLAYSKILKPLLQE